MQFIHAFDAIFELATVLRELLGYFVDAAWYVATERRPDGYSLPDLEFMEATGRSNVVTAWLYQSSRVSGISHIQQDQATIDRHESSFRRGQATFMLPSTTVGTKDFDMKPGTRGAPQNHPRMDVASEGQATERRAG
jgi:hypothetical protein